jgi:hypothetical protein
LAITSRTRLTVASEALFGMLLTMRETVAIDTPAHSATIESEGALVALPERPDLEPEVINQLSRKCGKVTGDSPQRQHWSKILAGPTL